MPEKRIDALREILAKAAARDKELTQALEALGADILGELGAGDAPPVWAVLEAADKERQVTQHFVLQDGWLCGDLVVEIAPEMKLALKLRMRTNKDGTHEVAMANEPSQGVVLDPPDEKHRVTARKKLFDHVFASLEAQVRQRVALPID